MDKSFPEKSKLKCPMCETKFIPESFHIESVVFDYHDGYGNNIMQYQNVLDKLKLKPHKLIRKTWVTLCPECNYLLRFAAEVGKKELAAEDLPPNTFKFNEFNKQFTYNFYTYNKPYMDYNDYINEKIDEIIEKIKYEFEKLRFAEWGNIYKAWTQSKEIDSYKFLIKFISNLEKYCESVDNKLHGQDMPIKFKALNLSSELESDLLDINKIRNDMVHHDFQLSQNDEQKIDITFSKLLYEIVLKNLKVLNLNNIQIEGEYSFINIEDIHREIFVFLHTEIGELLRLKDYYKSFLIPLINELGVKVKGVNL